MIVIPTQRLSKTGKTWKIFREMREGSQNLSLVFNNHGLAINSMQRIRHDFLKVG